MGIPKFFRWMSEKYPGLLVTARRNELPEIDNFYLDMNGIIHNCSHPCDGDVHFRITEEEMLEDIFNYIETLFGIIKPKEYFFMAVDGVAPRAKMNQQRGRRFRSAKEASDREEAALAKGDILPNEQRFDSNCITPGTAFMIKVNDGLKEFIARKLSTDPQWQRVKVILSGHETPGEGEHKIMDFIRYQRSQQNYRADTSHCLYGLDTDLIMLGLCSHEPNFMLLREEVKFGNKKSDATRGQSHRVDPSKITFNVLYLNLVRKYIHEDYLPLKQHMKFKFDLENIIDDWILICFLIGNDFIPHIPHFHIHRAALTKLFDVYKETLTKLDGYLNEKGVLNLKRFRVFTKSLAKIDFENYQQLLKENGGQCSKDDFSKLNMFVKHKMKVVGINSNPNGFHKRQGTRPDRSSHHSQYHKPSVWIDIQRGNTRDNRNNSNNFNHHHNNHQNSQHNNHQSGQYNNHQGGQYNNNHQSGQYNNHQGGQYNNNNNNHQSGQYNNHHNSGSYNGASNGAHQNGYNGRSNSYTPQRQLHTRTNKVASNQKPQNGSTNGRVGVHSFSEKEINNSITVCADGDFIELSDEEYLSDEKFPDQRIIQTKQPRNGFTPQRSTPKKFPCKEAPRQGKPNESDLLDFENYRRTYYKEKLKINPDKENITTVVNEYVRALQWNLHYYYHGCVSWGWFYPYHYAPFITDVVNFTNVNTEFELGEAFKPLDQLLSVLPAASSSLLPTMYRSLVTSKDSPLAQYFPTEVEYDLNGKQNDWEAVVLAPFIEEEVLLKASVLCNLFLSEDERSKNSHGPHLLFYYSVPKNSKGKRNLPTGRPAPPGGKIVCKRIPVRGFHVSKDDIRYGLLSNERQEVRT